MLGVPARGDIWTADLNPTRGHEQAGEQPVLVVSTDLYNSGPAGLVIVLPLTRADRHVPVHVPIDPPEGGLTVRSFVLCDAVRSISKDRLGQQRGAVSARTMANVADRLRLVMEL